MAKNFKWYGKKIKRHIVAGTNKNLRKAAFFLASDIRGNFPASGGGGRNAAGQFKGGGDNNNPSPAGGIPHVQTAHLKRNVGAEKAGEMLYKVGTGIGSKQSVGYALWLEFGTRDMAARPWLRPGIKRNRRKLRRIMAGKVLK